MSTFWIFSITHLCVHTTSAVIRLRLSALWDGEIYSLYLSFIRLMAIFDRIFLIMWSNITRRKFLRRPLSFLGFWIGTNVPSRTSICLCSLKHSFSTDLITSHSTTGAYLTSSAAIASSPGAWLLFNSCMAISTPSKLIGKLRDCFSPSKVSMVWWFLS